MALNEYAFRLMVHDCYVFGGRHRRQQQQQRGRDANKNGESRKIIRKKPDENCKTALGQHQLYTYFTCNEKINENADKT